MVSFNIAVFILILELSVCLLHSLIDKSHICPFSLLLSMSLNTLECSTAEHCSNITYEIETPDYSLVFISAMSFCPLILLSVHKVHFYSL